MAVFAPIVSPRTLTMSRVLMDNNKVPPLDADRSSPVMAPYAKISTHYPLGADYVGRDLFSRIVYGARISLTVAFIGPLISLMIGVIFGSISGYFGGRVGQYHDACRGRAVRLPEPAVHHPADGLLPRDVRQARAGDIRLRRQLSWIASMGGMLFIFIGIGLTAWETMARLTRGQVLSVREKEFVEAARTIGASNGRIMFKHILPNIIGPLIVA